MSDVYVSDTIARKTDLENVGGNADWNAQEGEAGYIKNRTHYEESEIRTLHHHVDYDNDGSYWGGSDDYVYIDKFPKTIKINNLSYSDSLEDTATLKSVYDVVTLRYFAMEKWNDYATISLKEYEGNYYLKITSNDTSSISGLEWGEPIEVTISSSVPLADKFIPNTIARKSDVQGFDPIVWKYICNPFKLKQNEYVPDELVKEINGKICFKYCKVGMYQMYRLNGDLTYIPITIGLFSNNGEQIQSEYWDDTYTYVVGKIIRGDSDEPNKRYKYYLEEYA